MRNVTITLDDDTARWARIEAAKRDTSVSRLVGQILRVQMLASGEYVAAKRSYEARAAADISSGGRYPTRDELHER